LGKNVKLKLPKTYLLFPVADERGDVDSRSPDLKGKKGIAMIIAIMIISVMMLFTSDLILSSQVNLQLATAHRDNLKAEYMAKSGMSIALLLLSADLAWDLFQAQQNPKGGGLNDGLGDFWSLMNGLPIGGETLEMVSTFQEQFGLSNVLDSEVMDQLQLFDGSFILDVADESQKINVNACYDTRCSEVMLMLESLFSCPTEKLFLEKRNVEPKEIAFRIKDFIDRNNKADPESGYNDEEDPYSRRIPRVKPKNAPLDSTDELKLVEGWDEGMHQVFSKFITVFPYPSATVKRFKINLNTASRSMLGCLFPESGGECAEKSALALKGRNTDKSALLGAGQKVNDILSQTFCYNQGKKGEASDKTTWFDSHSMVYRIESLGTVGNQQRTLNAVIERVMPNPKKNQKSAYKILYWKMI
jgi:general secretion pathway protein K